MMVKEIAAIVAMATPQRGIGYQGQLPWKPLKADMAHFAKITTTPPAAGLQNAVVMGRKTWESLPAAYRPLPKRTNVVLTTSSTTSASSIVQSSSAASSQQQSSMPAVLTVRSLEEAWERLEALDGVGNIFVIGGTRVYQDAMDSGKVNKVYVTEISNLSSAAAAGTEPPQFDAFFPELPATEWTREPFLSSNTNQHDNPEYTATKNNNNNNMEKENLQNQPSTTTLPTVDPKTGLAYQFWVYTRRPTSQPLAAATASSTTSTSTGTTGCAFSSLSSPPKQPFHPQPQPQQRRRNYSTALAATAHDNEDFVEQPKDSTLHPQQQQPPHEEYQYLNMIRDIMETGVERGDRTGVGTLSKFGTQMRFSLRDGVLPLLTTKRTFWRGVAEELLWFISGSTNANELSAKGIRIWDGNGSREFLDARGLQHREQGDLGPVYGFQWRHFGAKYVDMHTDYTGLGVDQLQDCIDKIKNAPEDRRIVMSAWNPADLELMALPPCHMFCQFYVDTVKNELSCQMYQRSADMGLGVPFNIASYALLTHLMAAVTGRKPGDFVHVIGDAHVYKNHVDALREQLTRTPRPFPTLKINPNKMNIDDFCMEDLELIGYNPHGKIQMEMAV